MLKLAFCFAGLVVLSSAVFVDMSFDDYVVRHNKRYTGAEYRTRRQIYEERVAAIKAHNARPDVTYWRAINRFTDMSEMELSALLGLNKVDHYARAASVSARSPLAPRVRSALPTEVDWTTKGAVTAVKNQGSCGSCWAFAGTESIESCGFLGSNKLVTLAPQEFVDCAPNPLQCGGSGGCAGATPNLLFDYAMTAGATLEEEYPYQARDQKCRMDGKTVAVTVGGYVNVTNNDNLALLEAGAGQPVTVGVAASSWFSYDHGVFSFEDCDSDVNHAVLLVGYGTDPKLGDYWKVQNSWGGLWGEKGFIRLARNDTHTECKEDKTPLDGFGCKGETGSVTVCGTCGILYGASYPKDCKVVV